nr:MAG TPA: baseplate protein [Caudoviricetes sp.]
MATSGLVKTDVLDDSYFWVQWSQSGQSIENNTTTISWSCGFNPGHQYYSNAIKMSAVYINGSQVYSGGTYSNITDYKNRAFASGTLTISHNTDGSKTFTVAGFNGWIYASGNTYASAQDFTLTTIPRASRISCSSANIGSNATISISRASSSFTHTLTYAFGSLSGTIATKTSSTSVSFPLPTSFYAQIPNAKNGTGTITCYTYNGSTLIGTKTCSFVANCDEDSCKPTLSGTVVDSNTATIALTGSNAKLIKYYSNVKITSNATAHNSSTLKSQKVSCGSKSITTSTGTINGVESGTFTFTATDSRGYQTILTKNLTLVEYVKLTCSMEAGMPTTAGVASLSVSGNYWNGNFGQVANTLTIQYRYKVQGGSYGNWTNSTATITKSNSTYKTEITISGLNYQNAYTFQVRATDKLATVESNEQTRKTTPVFDWGKNDFNINGTLKVNSTNIFDLIYPVGAVYISINSTSPQTLFGGTWEQIQGQFLLGASSAYPAGSTGGSKDAVVVAHTHNPANQSGYYGFITNASKAFSIGDMGSQSGSGRYYPYSTSSYDVSRNTQTGSTGVSGTDKNMPPYIAVYMWYRTA